MTASPESIIRPRHILVITILNLVILGVLLATVIAAVVLIAKNHGTPSDNRPFGSTWAVLIAGSSGYSNYRHQADVARAYHILLDGGIPKEQIILMMYDDVASDPSNPRPGTLFNVCDQNKNVYAGLTIDYRGKDVTSVNLANILLGNSAAVTGVGSGRVLRSTPSSSVLIYHTDHGGTGVIGMPAGPNLLATDLLQIISGMSRARLFESLVILIESCESGSMIDGLDAFPGVLGISASNRTQDSYAAECGSCAFVIGICLTDAFSDAWMRYAETASPMSTISDLVQSARSNTVSSTVTTVGDSKVAAMRLGFFFGWKDRISSGAPQKPLRKEDMWPSREVEARLRGEH